MALVVAGGIGFFIWQTFFTVKPFDGPLKITHDLSQGCSDARRYFPSAAAYSGSAPHPIAIFRDGDGSGGQEDEVVPSGLADDSYQTTDPGKVQLIACLGGASNGTRIGDCDFSGSDTLPLYRGEYDAVLYEAKTGKKVAEAHLEGSESKSDCPYSLYTQGSPDLHTSPDSVAIQRAFGPYVESAH
ncbi:MAG TPA: hypothetical protein VGL93_35095 [Streptosporangiaceae bacterium]